MHKSMNQHLTKITEINQKMIDVPESILIDSQLFDYIIDVCDFIYKPIIIDQFLSYSDVLDLFEKFILLTNNLIHANKIKMITLNCYLDNKLNDILIYSKENELYEVINNINHFNKIKDQLKKLHII